MSDSDSLLSLIAGRARCVLIPTFEEGYALSLVREAALARTDDLFIWNVVRGVSEGLVEGSPPVPGTEHPAAALLHFAALPGAPICVCLDLLPHLQDDRTLRALRDLIHAFDRTGGTLLLIDHRDEPPPVLAAHCARFDIPLPSEDDLALLLKATLKAEHRDRALALDLNRRGWESLVHNLRGLTRRQARDVIEEAVRDDRRLSLDDLPRILARKRDLVRAGGLLEFVEAPRGMDEIGGLDRLKAWLARRERSFSPDAAAFGLSPPRGMLLLGVPGSGKSLCAKAIATAWRRPLLRLDPAVLYDRYIGESERKLRDALRQAQAAAPVVLWIDEVEKAFASAASRSTDGGLSQRMFGALLTWLQEHREPVFVVATANDIEALPPELLRKGRFDEVFFVDLPGRDARRQIAAIHVRKRNRDPASFDLDALADASDGRSGSEIEQAIISALHGAFADRAALDTARILAALHDSPPLSVTMAERIAALRAWADGRCAPAE